MREQFAWAVALSFGPGVLLVVAAVWLGGATAAALLLFAFSVLALWLAFRFPPRRDFTRREIRIALAVFAAWAALALGSLVDIGIHGRLWMSVTIYDHGLRTAFIDAVLRTGVAPVDPVYWPGHDAPMRYYYFWYAVTAAVARLAHISARQALIASCVWPPVGVVAMLALFGRYVLGRRNQELTRLTACAACLLGVTGLDLLVTLALHLLGTPAMGDMEWWSVDQVSSWPDTFLWVPHHAAALVAALLGLLLLLRATETARRNPRLSVAALAGLSLASAFGMSAYLGIGVTVVVLGWLLANLNGKAAGRSLQSVAVAALVAAASLSGYLRQLLHRDGSGGPGVAPLSVGFREILSPAALAGSSLFHPLAASHPYRAREVAAGILLLPGWGVELGFYAIVFALALVRFRRQPSPARTVLWLTLSGFVAASILRSNVISTNDCGVRSALLPQFFLLLLGALVLASAQGHLRRFLWLLLVIGAGGCVYQIGLLRAYVPWQQAHGNPEMREVGERALALRNVYTALQLRIPVAARLQFDFSAESFYLYPHLLFANRQILTAESGCSTSFGGDPAACPVLQNGIVQLFPADPSSTPTAARAQRLCRDLGVQYLVVTRWDGAWQARSGWVWTLPAAVDQPSARVLACSP